MLILHTFFHILAQQKLDSLVGDLYHGLPHYVVNLLKDGFVLELQGDLLPAFWH